MVPPVPRNLLVFTSTFIFRGVGGCSDVDSFIQALRGNCAAAVKFAPELKRPLRHHQALAAAARAAIVEADNEASVGSSWDWACRAMSA